MIPSAHSKCPLTRHDSTGDPTIIHQHAKQVPEQQSTMAPLTWEYLNGLLNPAQSNPPVNLEELRKQHLTAMLAMPVAEVESAFATYVSHIDAIEDDIARLFQIASALVGRITDPNYHQVFHRRFTGLPRDLGFNDFLDPPRPSFVEGPEMREFAPFPIKRLGGAVLYRNKHRSLALPHLAGEVVPPGKMGSAIEKSAYVGAALVYARNQALKYLGVIEPAGYASVITFATDGNTVDFFAHFAIPVAPFSDQTEYHQYRLNSIKIHRESIEGFKQARIVMLNAQLYTRLRSSEVAGRLKQHWEQYGDQFVKKPAAQKAVTDEDLKHCLD